MPFAGAGCGAGAGGLRPRRRAERRAPRPRSRRTSCSPGSDRDASSPFTTDPAPRIAPLPRGEGCGGWRHDSTPSSRPRAAPEHLPERRAGPAPEGGLATHLDLSDRAFGMSYLAYEQLKAGQVDDAIATTNLMLDPPAVKPVAPPERHRGSLPCATCAAADAERIATHASVVPHPDRGAGVHGAGRSRPDGAIPQVLGNDPNALGARWLRHQRHDARQYPDSAAQWRLPADFFKPEATSGASPTWRQRRGSWSSVRRWRRGRRLDGDGNLDLFVVDGGLRPVALLPQRRRQRSRTIRAPRNHRRDRGPGHPRRLQQRRSSRSPHCCAVAG